MSEAPRRARSSMSRLFLVLLAPLAIGLVACNPFAAPPDGVPDSLSDGDRERIGEVVRDFFFGVDEFNPQLAGDSMVTPGEIGIENFAHMVLQIAALQSAELTFQYRVIESVSVDPEAEVVRASALTNLGSVQVELTRREGEWRIVSTPDLVMRPKDAPYQFEMHLTNTYAVPDGPFVVVGELENTGESTWLVLSMSGVLKAADGNTLRVEQSGLIARPFVDPGQSLAFRIDFALPEGVEFSEDAFSMLPNVRLERGADKEILASELTVEPGEIEGAPDTLRATVTNGEDELRNARVVAYVYAEDGRLLVAYQSSAFNIGGNGSVGIDVPGPSPAVAADADRTVLETWGVVPPAGG